MKEMSMRSRRSKGVRKSRERADLQVESERDDRAESGEVEKDVVLVMNTVKYLVSYLSHFISLSPHPIT